MSKITDKESPIKFVLRILNLKPFEGDGGDKGDKGDKGGAGDKGAKTFATLEEATAAFNKSEKEKRELLHETMDRKEKLRKLETEKEEADLAKQKEQGQFKEVVAKLEPKAKRLEQLEPVLAKLLELEIADVPEDKRDLVPNFENVEQKIEWIKNAKVKGLFGQPAAKPKPPKSEDGKPPVDGTTPEFVSYGGNDPRLLKLTPAEYEVWKKHNRAPKSTVVGWGG